MKACGTYSLTPVLALVGLVGLGVGGYNWVSTGCPLGGCGAPEAVMTATSVEKTGDCALCPSHDAAAVTTVAHTTSAADCSAAHDCAAEAKGGDCCKGAGEACCQETAAVTTVALEKSECSESAKSCSESDKAQCPMQKAQDEAKALEAKKTETKPTQPS